jgi:microcompartment protein CcmK/EutM
LVLSIINPQCLLRLSLNLTLSRRERGKKGEHRLNGAVMRIGRVVGRVWLNSSYETLVGGRFLIVAVQDRLALQGEPRKTTEFLICYDQLGAGEGELIAFGESREACMPFYPEKRVPIDAYNAAILDRVVVETR